MTGRPWVVILGSAEWRPSQPVPAPHKLDIDLAMRGGGGIPRRVAALAYQAGWRHAAMEHRVIAVYVLPGEAEAEAFAEFMTKTVDPAYVRQASDPDIERASRAGEVT